VKHTEISLRRPVTTTVVFVALALIGIIATRLLPLEMYPDIEFPGIFIQIPYPGSTPEEVERLITRPVEESLATLTGVQQMFSASTEDSAQIFMRFDWNQSMGAKGIEARAKVDSIIHLLPDDVRRILVFTGSLGDQPVLELRISSDRDLSDSYELLNRMLKRPIERLEGVSRVDLHGVEPREIRILLLPDRLAAHGVNIDQIRILLEKSNFAVSAGRITDAGQRFSVRPSGEFQSVDDIRDIVINRNNLKLSDVADVELRNPDREFGRHLDRKYAIGIAISKSTGSNMVEVTDRVMAEVERISRSPQMRGINIFDLDNQGDSVRKSLRDLLSSGTIGALLALLVLYAFLRQARTTVIVTACVPFSLLITLGALYFAGLTLNMLTMMGLMLAIGMLVDNAVVVTESVFRRRALDPDNPMQATLAGVKDVGIAVIAGTLTTIVVFVPVMFGGQNDVSVFLAHVGTTIIVALLASLLIAQTLIPMLAARIDIPPAPKTGSMMFRLTERYARGLNWILHHPWKTFGGIVLTCVIGVAPLILDLVKFDPFPTESSRRLYLPLHIDGEYPLELVEANVSTIEDYLFENQSEFDMRSVYSFFQKNRAAITILLTEEDEATVATSDVIDRIEANMPLIAIGKPSFEFQQQGGGEGFQLQISGESTAVLNEIGDNLVRLLNSVDGLEDVRTDAEGGDREVQISVDRVRAAAVGLTATEIARDIGVAMRGRDLREFRGETGEIAVRMAFRESDRQSVAQLADLPLYTPDGQRISLGSVANFLIDTSPNTIRRTDRQTAVILSANLGEDESLDTVRPRVQGLMDQFELPPGYNWKFGRGFQRQDETQQMMGVNIALGIACIFLIMAALFESMLLPFSIILGSIVFSVFGVFLFFAATGTTFSFMASIGIMILIGVVVNNGIVLIDHVNNLRLKGVPRNEAIVEAGRERIRPILMTVGTTIVGLAPLAISTTQVGGDGPPYFPMARAIIGGLAFSTIVSLMVVPALYAYFDTLALWGRNVMRVARGKGQDPVLADSNG